MGSCDSTPPRTALEDAHEATHGLDGKRQVIYPFAFKNLDWDEYHRYRPRYPDSLLKMWMSYHREHHGAFDCAHDVAGGPGTLAVRLAPHFARVVVSDAGHANIATAQRSLAPTTTSSPHSPNPGSKFTFIHSPAEAVHAALAPASVDLVSVGMAFHYFDAPRAGRSMAAMLRPGGTLAAVTYGFNLRFPGRRHLDGLWRAAASREALRLLRGGALFPAAVRGLASAMAGLDAVPLPTELFEPGAQRVLINVDDEDGDDGDGDSEAEVNGEEKSAAVGSSSPRPRRRPPLSFVDEDPSWEPAPVRVGATDVRRRIRAAADGSGWRREADAAWLRGFLSSCRMGFGERTWACAEWAALEAEVARAGGRVLVEWPVAVVMATRNSRPCRGP